MHSIIEKLQSVARDYRPNEEVCRELHAKEVALMVGPTSVGKSFLSDELIQENEKFGRVLSFTTRPKRPNDDDGRYIFLPQNDNVLHGIYRQASEGQLVQLAVHPTTHAVYGSSLESYAKEISVIDILATAVEPILQLPFRKKHILGVVCRPDIYRQRVAPRLADNLSDTRKRITEGVVSIDWLLGQQEVIGWVDNSSSIVEPTIQRITDYIDGYSQPDRQDYQTATVAVAEDLRTHLLTMIDR